MPKHQKWSKRNSGSKWLCDRSQNQFSKNYLALLVLGLRLPKFRLLVGNQPQRFRFWTYFCCTAAANCSIRPLLTFPYKNPFKMGPPSWTLRTSSDLDEIWHTGSSQQTSQRIKLPGESETKVWNSATLMVRFQKFDFWSFRLVASLQRSSVLQWIQSDSDFLNRIRLDCFEFVGFGLTKSSDPTIQNETEPFLL